MAKHSKGQETKIIDLSKYRQKQEEQKAEKENLQAAYEYEEEQAEEEHIPEEKKRRLSSSVPRGVYIACLVLVGVIVGLGLWVNREYLTWDNLKEWARLQVLGSESGDGFPVQITGSNVAESNFLTSGGSAVLLSNTALTIVSGEGKEELSVRHDLNQPVLRGAGGKYLLYNSGSTGYMVLSGTKTIVDKVAERDIITGCVSANGKYALGLEGSYGASKLEVYMPDGSLQYEYPFANDYITALAMNYDGTYGAVCTVRSEKGEMVSQLIIFDFSNTEPVASFETRGNLLIAAYWGENGVIYGVGDAALVSGKSADYQFQEYDYQGRQLTACCLDAGRAFLSISAYEHVGPSTLLVFNGGEAFGEQNPVRVEMGKRIEAISVSGGTAGLLAAGEIVFCDYHTGMELGRAEAGADAKSLALASERKAFVLGISEVRTAEAG